ncbi:MAG: dihydrodipicolinate synthetase [Phycisphaeraceae bacterium]|nr:dihydrodipicolinate synthetase [Phycisphaeraceae bacterium]
MDMNSLIAAPYTAMLADGDLNLELISRQAQALFASGVSGAFVCGTTGEGASLTLEERMAVAQRWCEDRPEGLSIIVHVGGTSLRDCQALAMHAQQIGADGIAAIAPYFFKPSSISQLGQWCQAVAGAAPELPFYYYHMPAMTGVDLSMEQLLTQCAPDIPNFAGIKFTHENLYDFGRCVDVSQGRYKMLFGRDEIMLSAIPLGADGAVGSTYNYAAPIYLKMIEAYNNGDLTAAAVYQQQSRQLVDLLIKYGGLATGKAIMQIIGIDCGPTRLPLSSLSTQQTKQLEADLQDIQFFDAIGSQISDQIRTLA